MKDTIKNIKKYARCMALDAANTFIDFMTVLCSIILLILQLISWPFKYLAFIQEGESCEETPTIDELEDIDIDEALEELFDGEELTIN